MSWAAFIVIVLIAAWLEESETRRAEIGVTLVMLLAVLAFLEIIR